MRCRLIILTFATLIVPALASEALATTVDIRSITCRISRHAGCTIEQVLGLDDRLV